jgi:hypothetical protein
VIRGKGDSSWPTALDDLPANLRIMQLSTSGSGQVVEDNSERVSDLLAALLPPRTGTATPVQPPRGVPVAGSTGSAGSGAQNPVPSNPRSGAPGNAPASGSPATSSGGDGLCSVRAVGAVRGQAGALAWIWLALLVCWRTRRSTTAVAARRSTATCSSTSSSI